MPLGMEVGLGPGLIVLDGDPAPSPQKGGQPPPLLFSAHIYCDQTAGWIKVLLGMDVGLTPSDIVLHGDPAPLSPKGGSHRPPNFGPCLSWPSGWMNEDASWYGGRLWPRGHIMLDGDPASPKGHSPQFSTHVYCVQTVVHLSYC